MTWSSVNLPSSVEADVLPGVRCTADGSTEGGQRDGQDDGEQTEEQRGEHLRRDHLRAVRLEGERHHAGALAPLLGDQQDAEHRQQEALRVRITPM